MKTNDFNYDLPIERIAQTPIEPRHNSRLLILDRDKNIIEHRKFFEIGEFLKDTDLLIINRTKVIPARIFAQKITGGKIEILLLRQVEKYIWECLVGGKRVNVGTKLRVANNIQVEVLANLEGSKRLIQFDQEIETVWDEVGQMPLPPYIHEPLKNPNRYQTVFAQNIGSAAAPTAGLHFSNELIKDLRKKGVRFCEITLHVGLDTFAPVTEKDPLEHKIHTEWCEISYESANLINETSKIGGRIIAIGTTSVRTLETGALHAKPGDRVGAFSGSTGIFIIPGYQFKAVDAMVTNFHLPKSTLLMLVSAFAGQKKILDAYQCAINEKYRFYSFGDAMLIL
ncbi:MAG: tRNA preQ1(34) S-adenosylmethionine ribosyltransferase-isomerase QueA [Anaerolineaceae bacterium]